MTNLTYDVISTLVVSQDLLPRTGHSEHLAKPLGGRMLRCARVGVTGRLEQAAQSDRRRSSARRANGRGFGTGDPRAPAAPARDRSQHRRRTTVLPHLLPATSGRAKLSPARRLRWSSAWGERAARPSGQSNSRGQSLSGRSTSRPNPPRSADRPSGARDGSSSRARGCSPRRTRVTRRVHGVDWRLASGGGGGERMAGEQSPQAAASIRPRFSAA
jgi:hypothetical protein